MKKLKIVLTTFFTILLVLITIAVVYQNIKNDKIAKSESKVTDECTEEGNMYYDEEEEDDDEIIVSSAETKVSPNAKVIIERYYKGCGHKTKEYMELPTNLVNKTQEEVEENFPDYKIEGFSANEISLIKEEEGQCKEHYILKDENSNVVIYTIDANGEEKIYQKTGISTEFLPQTDKINLENGMKVFGKENLNSILEDFE